MSLGYEYNELDAESGLDFAQARYYGNGLGRFTGVDPSLENIDATQPQSWNRYIYCYNNPLNATDPTALAVIWGYIQQGDIRRFEYFPDSVLKTGYTQYFGFTFKFSDGSLAGMAASGKWSWLLTPAYVAAPIQTSDSQLAQLPPAVPVGGFVGPIPPPVEAPPIAPRTPVSVGTFTFGGTVGAIGFSNPITAALMILLNPASTGGLSIDDYERRRKEEPIGITLFRGADALNAGTFSFEADGLTVNEVPDASRKYNVRFNAVYNGPKVPGTTAFITDPRLFGGSATYTPQWGPTHWSINFAGGNDETVK